MRNNFKWKSVLIILLLTILGTTTWFYYINKSNTKIPEKARLVTSEDYKRC
ncbi:hypothetical protein SAMN02746089_00428 [Caldanaerobius fijiensis DSM 17918]|uniref:Uncharacterized protein n=1 Tax=Caldanaerobius fijiensis DSM 17918 TaxID=1121256 RepID=A0A1M4UB62_9THEO|nr:hypothetical protein SAMN02746089_00428 [Caldanaerobius fijiensis DSM 17918]